MISYWVFGAVVISDWLLKTFHELGNLTVCVFIHSMKQRLKLRKTVSIKLSKPKVEKLPIAFILGKAVIIPALSK